MNRVEWKNVNFSWEEERPVFQDLSLKLGGGVHSLVGQNGSGKSTFMLLSSGRILPSSGEIYLLGQKTDEIPSEEQRNRMASFVYQNMEFETEQSLTELFEMVLKSGNIASGGEDLQKELIELLELSPLVDRKLQQLSKGEMQRAIVIFSLLYGSPLLFLDEPFFAMEEYQKEKILGYLKDYCKSTNVDIFLSMHQLELTRKYTDNVLFIYKNGAVKQGSSAEMLTKENLEELFQVPESLLYKKEKLFRKSLDSEGKFPEGKMKTKVYD